MAFLKSVPEDYKKVSENRLVGKIVGYSVIKDLGYLEFYRNGIRPEQRTLQFSSEDILGDVCELDLFNFREGTVISFDLLQHVTTKLLKPYNIVFYNGKNHNTLLVNTQINNRRLNIIRKFQVED